MQLDPDAVLWSAPERERSGRPLIVLLHGYGSHEGDLFALSPRLPLEPVVASVRAPIAMGPGNAWWEIVELGVPNPAAVNLAVDAVLGWLDTLSYTSVSLVGFSQGGAIALQALRAAPDRFAATVSLAGFVPTRDHPNDAELARLRPPVFWGRGTLDPVIPQAAIAFTQEWLPEHADADIRIYEGLGHAVSADELSDFADFLARHP
jgi:phospholipase/carboxylesterase